MLQQIDHVNIVVRDLERMISFYSDVLEMKVSKRVTISGDWVEQVVGLQGVEADVAYLELPDGPRVELIFYRQPASPPSVEVSQANIQGLRHLAFRVTDIDTVVDRLRGAGTRFFSDVITVPTVQVKYDGGARKRLVYLRDPEDNLLELCEYA